MRHARPTIQVGLLLSAALVVLMVTPPTPAVADACSTEETIFAAYTGGAYGTYGEIKHTDRDINSSCGQYTPLAWSTAHMRLGGATYNWAEVGWEEEYVLSFHQFYAFTEWGLNGNTKARNQFSEACLTQTSYQMWRVSNVSGTNDWNLAINCENGTGWSSLKKYTGTGYYKGLTMGETGRYGGTATGMSDYQDNLHWKNSSGTWNKWSGPYCYSDVASNWQFNYLSATSYSVVKGSMNC